MVAVKPILFNTEMVRAILEGRKTVTRRVVKPHFRPGETGWQVITEKHSGKYVRIEYLDEWENETRYMSEPFRPDDILYVRETWTTVPDGSYVYKASVECPDAWAGTWRPSIHMPKEAARLFLRVTDVRVERLQDITSEQIDAEGCKEWAYSAKTGELLPSGPSFFRIQWDTTIKPANLPIYGWDANPWVWVIEFERVSKEAALKGGEG